MIQNKSQVTYEAHGDALVIRLCGEIDHHSAVSVRTAIDEKLMLERPARVFLDLSSIEFMDSSGLGLMMGRFALVRKYGGKLAVSDPSPAVVRILSLAGMDRMIPVQYTKKNTNRKEVSK